MRWSHGGRSLLVGAAIVSACALTSATARAGDPAAAREQVKIGYQLAQEGKCDQAIPHFLESVKLDIKAVTLINLASCEEKVGKLADALGHWVEARSRAQAENNSGIQEEAEKRAKALEPRLPKLTVTLAAGAPGDVEVVRDGVALGSASMGVPLPVNPGSHTLVVRAKGYEDATTTTSIAEAEQKKIELKLGAKKLEDARAAAPPAPAPGSDAGQASPSSGGTSPLVFIGFGAAVAGVAVGSITGIMAFGKASDADAGCPTPTTCSKEGLDAADSGKTLGTISTIGFAVAGVGALVGIYGLVWGKPSASTSMAVSIGPTGGVVRGTF